MSKQAKKAEKTQQIKSQELDLQMRFSKLSIQQRQSVANYLNAYNLAAWIFNEIIDEDCRIYIDLAMKYTMETQALANSMKDVNETQDVEKLVKEINDGK